MKIDLGRINWEGQWYDFRDGGKLKIRPLPRSKQSMTFKMGGEFKLDRVQQGEEFKYCLMDIEGIDLIDKNGNPVKFDESTKMELYNSNSSGISDFVMLKITELANAMAQYEKN